jgi:hypothetical protein
MAIYEPRFRGRMAERSSRVPIGIAAAIALILGWWLMNNDAGMTRTSAPANNQTDTNTTNSPGTSKQP